jgi:cytochrome c556
MKIKQLVILKKAPANNVAAKPMMWSKTKSLYATSAKFTSAMTTV